MRFVKNKTTQRNSSSSRNLTNLINNSNVRVNKTTNNKESQLNNLRVRERLNLGPFWARSVDLGSWLNFCFYIHLLYISVYQMYTTHFSAFRDQFQLPISSDKDEAVKGGSQLKEM
uniref:Uncharacterized protein n=1 Tax=Solanum tuberosum TaxID=4113 RepID=M1BG99_SOLTU